MAAEEVVARRLILSLCTATPEALARPAVFFDRITATGVEIDGVALTFKSILGASVKLVSELYMELGDGDAEEAQEYMRDELQALAVEEFS